MLLWTAAHDTFASAMTSLLYEFGRSPEWQERLRREITEQIPDITALQQADLAALPLTDAAFREALRLHTPAFQTPRVAVRDVHFKSHAIPKGTLVTTSLADVQRDRFLPEAAGAPFGSGPHSRIGSAFAIM